MKKYYYGLWQNFYNLSWPVRFFIELAILICIVVLIIKVLTGKKIQLHVYLAKCWAWLVTEILYLAGRNKEWAVETDHKMIEWANDIKNGANKNRYFGWKCLIWIGILALYFMAVFVDLPFSKNLHDSYLDSFANIKIFFQKYEQAISEGYENYPPLFVKKEVEESEEEAEEEAEEESASKEKVQVNIKLNEKGKRGSNIRGEASLDGKIVGGVNGEDKILYSDQLEYDGERYWLKVYLSEDNIEGWLSGNLVDSDQMEMIVNDFGD